MRTGMEWDEWFLELCNVVAKKSQCHSRKIGSILVKDKSIVSTGYNGPPRGVIPCDERWLVDKKLREKAGFKEFITNDCKLYKDKLEGKCPRYVSELGFKSGQGLEWCVAGHAEENSILNAARNGIETRGTIMYMNCNIPCKNCLIKIINAGIEEIVVTGFKVYDISSDYLVKQSNLKVRLYSHLKEDEGDGEY